MERSRNKLASLIKQNCVLSLMIALITNIYQPVSILAQRNLTLAGKTNSKSYWKLLRNSWSPFAVNLSNLQEILLFVKLNEHTISDVHQLNGALSWCGIRGSLSKLATNLDNYLWGNKRPLPRLIYIARHSKCITIGYRMPPQCLSLVNL